MALLYDLKQKLRRALPPSVRPKVEEAIYLYLYNFSPARRQNFFNGGYAPAAERFVNTPPFDKEPLQATLYDYVLWEMAAPHGGPRGDILDIGCGLGGGCRIAAERYPNARITGVDASGAAVRASRKRLADLPNVDVVRGNGRELPFKDASFDFIFSVGAASYIGMPEFFREASRVLRPGGLLSFSVGYTAASFPRQVRAVNEHSAAAGLDVLEIKNITEHVFAAIDADVPRRQALIDKTPSMFRGYAREWGDMPGTARYQQYVNGRRLDYVVICRKPE